MDFGTYNNTIRCNIKERRPYITNNSGLYNITYIPTNKDTMKDWDDFIPNDDDEFSNEDERDLFGTHRLEQEIEKGMFLQDADSGHPLVLDPPEFKELFGKITEDDLQHLTQSFFTHYHRLNVSVDDLFDRWGGDWIFEVLKHCERREEYELCSIIKDMWQDKKLKVKDIELLIRVAE